MTPTIPDWPTYQNDDLVNDNGTALVAEFFDAIGESIEAQLKGTDNPNDWATDIIDEVIAARGTYLNLKVRLDDPVVGTINDDVSAADIVDEVVSARDDDLDLSTRLSQFVDDEIPDAEVALRGLVNDEAQVFGGAKTFAVQPTITHGASGTVGDITVGGLLYSDLTPRSGSGVAEVTLSSYSLPANSLNADGKGIRVTAWGKFGLTTGGSAPILYWGGTALIVTGISVNTGLWRMQAHIFREGVNKQSAFVTLASLAGGLNTGTLVDAIELSAVWDSSNAGMQKVETGAIIVKTTAIDAADGSIWTQFGFVIEAIG